MHTRKAAHMGQKSYLKSSAYGLHFEGTLSFTLLFHYQKSIKVIHIQHLN